MCFTASVKTENQHYIFNDTAEKCHCHLKNVIEILWKGTKGNNTGFGVSKVSS
jgi:hypothetical protein